MLMNMRAGAVIDNAETFVLGDRRVTPCRYMAAAISVVPMAKRRRLPGRLSDLRRRRQLVGDKVLNNALTCDQPNYHTLAYNREMMNSMLT